MGEDNLGLSTLAQGAKKNYEFLVKRDTGQFWSIFDNLFHFYRTQHVFASIQRKENERRFPKIQHIFSSTFPSENIPCNFQDDVEIVNGQKLLLEKNMFTILSYLISPPPPIKKIN